ncbi:hypothetical protein BC835DRAFT_550949 [Cytidiella melzeri]|nr:hypothetical protein BC835DRAFT_550949 [Cytidiella melzeri]
MRKTLGAGTRPGCCRTLAYVRVRGVVGGQRVDFHYISSSCNEPAEQSDPYPIWRHCLPFRDRCSAETVLSSNTCHVHNLKDLVSPSSTTTTTTTTVYHYSLSGGERLFKYVAREVGSGSSPLPSLPSNAADIPRVHALPVLELYHESNTCSGSEHVFNEAFYRLSPIRCLSTRGISDLRHQLVIAIIVDASHLIFSAFARSQVWMYTLPASAGIPLLCVYMPSKRPGTSANSDSAIGPDSACRSCVKLGGKDTRLNEHRTFTIRRKCSL